MMRKLRCCLYILLAKRYAVFTYDEGEVRATCREIHKPNEQFLDDLETYVQTVRTIIRALGKIK